MIQELPYLLVYSFLHRDLHSTKHNHLLGLHTMKLIGTLNTVGLCYTPPLYHQTILVFLAIPCCSRDLTDGTCVHCEASAYCV